MNLELKKAIDQISKDKGLDRDMLVDTLEDAVRTSVIRKYGENIDVEVSYNDDTGEIQVHQFKIVVDDVADPDTEIDIEKARELDPSVQLDDEIGFPLKVTDLGRIAAQSAKQVIIQRMRDAEQELIYEEFKDRVGEICSGIIQRRDKGGWIINLGRTEAILPKEEQIPREHYKRGDRVQALIIEVKKEGRGPQIVISRSHRDYTAALFRREVPEVDEGVIQILGVARDPGSRAKVAVDQGDHHLHDKRQQRQGHHEVLRVLMTEHIDAGHGHTEHDGRGAAHQELHGGHACHQGIGRSEDRGERGIKHNDHPFGRSGSGEHYERNGRRRHVRTPGKRRRTC